MHFTYCRLPTHFFDKWSKHGANSTTHIWYIFGTSQYIKHWYILLLIHSTVSKGLWASWRGHFVGILVKGIGHAGNQITALLITSTKLSVLTTTPNTHVTKRWNTSTHFTQNLRYPIYKYMKFIHMHSTCAQSINRAFYSLTTRTVVSLIQCTSALHHISRYFIFIFTFNSILDVSMQRLSATITVTPKGRIINSCTVDYQTVFMLIMETQVSKLTLSHTPEQNGPSGTEQSGVVPIPNPWACESHKWPPQGQTFKLATSQVWTPDLQALKTVHHNYSYAKWQNNQQLFCWLLDSIYADYGNSGKQAYNGEDKELCFSRLTLSWQRRPISLQDVLESLLWFCHTCTSPQSHQSIWWESALFVCVVSSQRGRHQLEVV